VVEDAPMKRMGNPDDLAASHSISHRRRVPLFAVRSFRSMEGLQRRLDVTPDGSEFDLRWVADIRYGLRRWSAARHRKSVSDEGPEAVLRESGGGLAGRFSVALSTGNSAFCVAVALVACLGGRPSRSIRVIRTGLASN